MGCKFTKLRKKGGPRLRNYEAAPGEKKGKKRKKDRNKKKPDDIELTEVEPFTTVASPVPSTGAVSEEQSRIPPRTFGERGDVQTPAERLVSKTANDNLQIVDVENQNKIEEEIRESDSANRIPSPEPKKKVASLIKPRVNVPVPSGIPSQTHFGFLGEDSREEMKKKASSIGYVTKKEEGSQSDSTRRMASSKPQKFLPVMPMNVVPVRPGIPSKTHLGEDAREELKRRAAASKKDPKDIAVTKEEEASESADSTSRIASSNPPNKYPPIAPMWIVSDRPGIPSKTHLDFLGEDAREELKRRAALKKDPTAFSHLISKDGVNDIKITDMESDGGEEDKRYDSMLKMSPSDLRKAIQMSEDSGRFAGFFGDDDDDEEEEKASPPIQPKPESPESKTTKWVYGKGGPLPWLFNKNPSTRSSIWMQSSNQSLFPELEPKPSFRRLLSSSRIHSTLNVLPAGKRQQTSPKQEPIATAIFDRKNEKVDPMENVEKKQPTAAAFSAGKKEFDELQIFDFRNRRRKTEKPVKQSVNSIKKVTCTRHLLRAIQSDDDLDSFSFEENPPAATPQPAAKSLIPKRKSGIFKEACFLPPLPELSEFPEPKEERSSPSLPLPLCSLDGNETPVQLHSERGISSDAQDHQAGAIPKEIPPAAFSVEVQRGKDKVDLGSVVPTLLESA